MKKLKFLCLILSLLPFSLSAQINSNLDPETMLEVYPLEVTLHKTTSIRFPESIISADVGSIGILAEPFEKVENVLRVKANKENFEEASLTVVTGDSRIYTFVVRYTANPRYLTLDMNKAQSIQKTNVIRDNHVQTEEPFIKFEATKMDVATIKALSAEVKSKRRKVKHLGIENYDLVFTVDGIYIKENVMFFQLKVKNRSHIDYDVDLIQLLVRDKTVARRTSQQEIAIEPILSTDKTEIIKGKSMVVFTYAISKLTIPDNKELIIQLYEQGGGRHLEFKISNQDLINSLPLS